MDEARAKGCTDVMAKGQFANALPKLLAGLSASLAATRAACRTGRTARRSGRAARTQIRRGVGLAAAAALAFGATMPLLKLASAGVGRVHVRWPPVPRRRERPRVGAIAVRATARRGRAPGARARSSGCSAWRRWVRSARRRCSWWASSGPTRSRRRCCSRWRRRSRCCSPGCCSTSTWAGARCAAAALILGGALLASTPSAAAGSGGTAGLGPGVRRRRDAGLGAGQLGVAHVRRSRSAGGRRLEGDAGRRCCRPRVALVSGEARPPVARDGGARRDRRRRLRRQPGPAICAPRR